MGAKRLPIQRMLVLLVALAGFQPVWGGDLKFGPPPIEGGRQAKPQSGNRSTARSPQKPAKPVSYDETVSFPVEEEVIASPSLDIAGSNARHSVSDAGTVSQLEPIEMPDEDELSDNPYLTEQPARTLSSGRWLNRGRWYTQEEVTFMSRSARQVLILSQDFSPPVNTRNPIQLQVPRNLAWAPGARITLGCFLGRDPMNRDSSIEFTFLGLNNWNLQEGLVSRTPNGLFTLLDPSGGSLGAFNAANFQEYTYNSKFNSYEANAVLGQRLGRDRMVLTRDGSWVRTAAPHFLPTLFGGLRLITINEKFDWLSQGSDPTTRSGRYVVHTHNTMFGAQMGSDIRYQHGNWQAGTRVKFGGYLNFADQESQVTIHDAAAQPDPSDRNEKGTKTPLSFVGEVALNGAYLFRPNMAIRAGYDFMFLSQLALADRQLSFVSRPPIMVNTSPGLFIQGVSVGFDFVW